MGYARAGFEVVGVDLVAQPRYPFEFVCEDALMLLGVLVGQRSGGSSWLDDFDAIHASPPCQAHTSMSNRWRGTGGKADEHIDLIPATRELLKQTGLPYVIENVPGARAALIDSVTLTGEMFGLGVHRPRLFESNVLLLVAPKPVPSPSSIGVYGKAHDGRLLWRRADGSEQHAASDLEQARAAMGIDWMEWRELCEAIPPAYTEHIGHQLMQHVQARSAA